MAYTVTCDERVVIHEEAIMEQRLSSWIEMRWNGIMSNLPESGPAIYGNGDRGEW